MQHRNLDPYDKRLEGLNTAQLRTRVNALKKICKHADFRTRKMVAGGIVQSKLQCLLPLFGAAPAYLLRHLQVQQMAAARAVVGLQGLRWSNTRTLNFLGWLNINQQYAASTLILTHKIVTTRRPENIYRSMVMPFPYQTRRATEQQIRTWAGTTRGQDRTATSMRTFKYQGIALYNSIPMQYRNYNQEQFKNAVKKWARSNVV